MCIGPHLNVVTKARTSVWVCGHVGVGVWACGCGCVGVWVWVCGCVGVGVGVFVCLHFVLPVCFMQVGFAAPEAATGLKLLEAGVPKEKLALIAVPLMPLQIITPLVLRFG